jgi:hypothetical protein
MSTRTRVSLCLTDNGKTAYTGSVAVRYLLAFAKPYGDVSRVLKEYPYNGLTKREKLLKLATHLPEGYTLVLVQEPRGTRKKLSHYWQGRGVENGLR